MIRPIAVALCIAAMASPTYAQGSLDAAKKIWTGVWEGPVWHAGESSPIGGFRLEIAHDSTWKVTIDVITGQTTSGMGTDFAPAGNRATWKSALMGQSCGTTATIEGAVLKGETRCGEYGGLTFELKKQKP